MMHKGVHYTVAVTAVPSIWKWQFQIGDAVKTGKTETRINLLAIRRVQLRNRPRAQENHGQPNSVVSTDLARDRNPSAARCSGWCPIISMAYWLSQGAACEARLYILPLRN